MSLSSNGQTFSKWVIPTTLAPVFLSVQKQISHRDWVRQTQTHMIDEPTYHLAYSKQAKDAGWITVCVWLQ